MCGGQAYYEMKKVFSAVFDVNFIFKGAVHVFLNDGRHTNNSKQDIHVRNNFNHINVNKTVKPYI